MAEATSTTPSLATPPPPPVPLTLDLTQYTDDAVYQRVIPGEQGRDPDKKGLAVLSRVDPIRQCPQRIKR